MKAPAGQSWSRLRAALASEIHVWRWSGPREGATRDEVIAEYLGLHPDRIVWRREAHGKPAVVGAELECNWSHCRGEMLLAVARGCAVGIDIERPRRLRARGALLERFFTASERGALNAVDDTAVLRAWAHKEALVKAIGRGIAYGLQRVVLDLAHDKVRLASLQGPAAVGPWNLASLPQVDDAVAALAWSGEVRAIRSFQIDPATLHAAGASFGSGSNRAMGRLE